MNSTSVAATAGARQARPVTDLALRSVARFRCISHVGDRRCRRRGTPRAWLNWAGRDTGATAPCKHGWSSSSTSTHVDSWSPDEPRHSFRPHDHRDRPAASLARIPSPATRRSRLGPRPRVRQFARAPGRVAHAARLPAPRRTLIPGRRVGRRRCVGHRVRAGAFQPRPVDRQRRQGDRRVPSVAADERRPAIPSMSGPTRRGPGSGDSAGSHPIGKEPYPPAPVGSRHADRHSAGPERVQYVVGRRAVRRRRVDPPV